MIPSFNHQDNAPKSNASAGPTNGNEKTDSAPAQVPSISLPKGGGAIKGIEEKFQVNAVTGTSSFGIPVPVSPSRQGFVPAIGLSYNSGLGNSPYGIGWQLAIPSVKRKSTTKLPTYKDEEEADTFIISDAEDMVPLLEKKEDGSWQRFTATRSENGKNYTVKRYRPRIEGLFARIEKWQEDSSCEVHWRTITKNNVHSYYGLSSESRVSDPDNTAKVFEWLLCRTHDNKGNICIYTFKKEDFSGVEKKLNEKNRIGNCTQTYLKTILYGNKQPYYLGDAIPAENDFMFRVMIDYGEHDASEDIPKDIDIEKTAWTCRKDPFSTYRSGFEIRTYRRCSRILMFHCFDETELPHSPYLTKSLQLFYDDSLALAGDRSALQGFSFLTKARQNGHLWDAATNVYKTKSLPEMEINYQPHEWNTEVQEVTPDNLVHSPVGLADKRYLWIDLFSEGISGILTEQAEAWYYKSNLGNGNFSHARSVAPKPVFSRISTGNVFIEDLEGNGTKYLVNYDKEPKGFFKLTDDEEWEPMKNFEATPNMQVSYPGLRRIDLNGDLIADLLFIDDDKLVWHLNKGEKGFEVSQTLIKEIDEEKGPTVIFSDQDNSVFLADMSGDGLTDIVRICNGEICYWPNLGYGRFGSKVSMDNAPLFDYPDTFNPSYLRLADIDGSGTTDVIYLGKNEFQVWMNRNGNEWDPEPEIISAFPQMNDVSDVSVLDFLGSGTACIVYSSSINNQPFQYIDLMGSKKPALFTGYQNNCGKEISLDYKPSTFFYLEDKKKGNPWITKLPFPVHCISTVRSEDKIRETVFTCSYTYHHGYFDHEEQEYRGFARVETLDTEDYAQFKINEAKNVVEEDLHQPPVKTVSWYHTGAYLRNKKIIHQCESEYFKNEFFNEYVIPEPVIPNDVTIDELREAYRACKGASLRSEVYAMDGSEKSLLPYSASQSVVDVRLVQPKDKNHYASFIVVPSESVSYAYERNPSDPRISQSFVIETDELGNIKKSGSVVYPRVARPAGTEAIPDKVWDEQSKMHIVYNEAFFTSDILEDEVYRLREGYESKSYEINGIPQQTSFFFSKEELAAGIALCSEILFEDDFDGTKQKRLSAHHRGYFYKDDLSGPLPLGQLSALGIPFKSYQLAFTKNLISKFYGTRVTSQMLTDAKYVHSEGDEHWWTQPGEAIYPVSPRNHFYIPFGGRDIFGNESFAEYDQYDFLTVKTTDAIGNFSTAQNDYRTLSAVLLTDPNLNRAAVETDELGMVIKSAVMGKEGAGEGDTLADPTARMEYDLFNWKNHNKPNYVHMLAREQHGAANLRWQESYVYSDGGGSVIMTKSQANPGKAKRWNPETKLVEESDANPRWIGNGRTIFNNKGNPVKKYEPYFSTTFEYESEDELVETGVSAVAYYDPVGRNIRTEFPNGTFSKVEFNSWHLKSYDVNDTVKESKWYADRGSPDPSDAEPNDPEERAAWLAAKHYNTPGIAFSDSLGRTVYAITDYGNGKTTNVFSEADSGGRFSKMFDQLGRLVSEDYVNLLGQSVYGKTAEKGERWIFTDVMGRLVKVWDNDIREMYCSFDELHRPVSTFVKEGAGEILFGHVIYGDMFSDADAKTKNIKGRAYQVYDQAGVITIAKVDFKGNATQVERRLTKEYKQAVNWSLLGGIMSIPAVTAAATPVLEPEVFSSSVAFDALNRPVTVTMPDKSVVQPKYNEAGYLDSLKVKIRGAGNFVTFLDSQDYDAKGQRQFARYGNNTITNYFYDPKTFRLTNLVTKLTAADGDGIQNLKYNFDPAGNITQIRDDAQQTHFFKNAVVYPENKYEYDAVYQLTKAAGREHAGAGGNVQRGDLDLPFISQLPHDNDSAAIRNYTEQYGYDDCGNIKKLQHITANANWTLRYQYEYESNPANNTNRLQATSLPGDADGIFSAIYGHDLHGNMTSMPHLSAPDSMKWNFMDQLHQVNLGGGGNAYYVYGSGGNRIRKIIERQGGLVLERIYMGAIEIYRERQGNNTPDLERFTLHISDNTGRIAQVDTKTIDKNNSDEFNALDENVIRYQYSNHLGSATLETDDAGNIISYEEYHPYGTSTYRVSKPGTDFSLKHYRFSGKERDDETGFYYFGARYYAAWLGRWTSSDPGGFVRGSNLFKYCSDNPIMFHDPNGMQDRWRTDWHSLGTEQDPVTHTRIDSVPEFERWAVRHGIEYEGTPQLRGRTFEVTHWRQVEPGHGGSSTSFPSQTPRETPPPSSNPVETVRQGVIGANQPQLTAGGTAPGDLHLYSGTTGDTAAQAASASGGGEGYYLRDTPHYARANAAESALQTRLGRPLNYTTEARPIWDQASRDLVREATLAARGVESHGLDTYEADMVRAGTPRSVEGTTQVMEEIPAAIKYGGATAILGLASGAFTIWSASHSSNPMYRYVGYGAGGGEIAGAGAYGYGVVQLGLRNAGSASTMAGGALAMRAFGGTGAIVMSTISLGEHLQSGDYGLTVSDGSGFVGGFGILAGSAPVAVGAGGIALANVGGDWAERRVTPAYGRGAGIAAGGAVGLGVGGVVAGGLVAFGLVSNPVGWAILAGGGIAGLIGAIW